MQGPNQRDPGGLKRSAPLACASPSHLQELRVVWAGQQGLLHGLEVRDTLRHVMLKGFNLSAGAAGERNLLGGGGSLQGVLHPFRVAEWA